MFRILLKFCMRDNEEFHHLLMIFYRNFHILGLKKGGFGLWIIETKIITNPGGFGTLH